MKYPKLNSLVPAGEHFDESAINEGVYLTTGHVNSIEETLAGHVAALNAVNVQLTEANNSITTLNEAATTSATTIKTQAERIVELEGQVEKLGKDASGTGTTLKAVDETEQPEETTGALPRYDSPNHPANMAAQPFLRVKK